MSSGPDVSADRPSVDEIRGRAFRRYSVRDVAEIDVHLSDLRLWLVDSIDRDPSQTRRHIESYVEDMNRLLDARWRRMTEAS